jgi:subtilisin family serine protease
VTIQNGRVDIWAIDDEGGATVMFTTKVQDAMKIGSPGAAHSAITVASFTTRNQWIDIGGVAQSVGLQLDDISSFSSEGPLRGGFEKPDVAAPGAMIAAPASSDAPMQMLIAPGFRLDAGTSMATPFITGLVALLLEGNGTLTPAAVLGELKAHSSVPQRPGGAHDPKWGFGLINAQNL